jgi:hypothetical protein
MFELCVTVQFGESPLFQIQSEKSLHDHTIGIHWIDYCEFREMLKTDILTRENEYDFVAISQKNRKLEQRNSLKSIISDTPDLLIGVSASGTVRVWGIKVGGSSFFITY